MLSGSRVRLDFLPLSPIVAHGQPPGGPWGPGAPWRPLVPPGAPGGPWQPLAAPCDPWRTLAAPCGPLRPLAAAGGTCQPLAAPGSIWQRLAAPRGAWRPLVTGNIPQFAQVRISGNPNLREAGCFWAVIYVEMDAWELKYAIIPPPPMFYNMFWPMRFLLRLGRDCCSTSF